MLKGLRDALNNAVAALRTQQSDIDAAINELERHQTAPVNNADLKQLCHTAIDKEVTAFEDRLAKLIDRSIRSHPLDVMADKPLPVFTVYDGGNVDNDRVNPRSLVALMSVELKAIASRVIDTRFDDSEAGLPLAERHKRVKDLRKQLASLEDGYLNSREEAQRVALEINSTTDRLAMKTKKRRIRRVMGGE